MSIDLVDYLYICACLIDSDEEIMAFYPSAEFKM
jgi:hypothetical protein